MSGHSTLELYMNIYIIQVVESIQQNIKYNYFLKIISYKVQKFTEIVGLHLFNVKNMTLPSKKTS